MKNNKKNICFVLCVCMAIALAGCAPLPDTGSKEGMQEKENVELENPSAGKAPTNDVGSMEGMEEEEDVELENPPAEGIWDSIYFGNCPQGDAAGNTKEPIKWRVLSINGNDAFLLADQILAIHDYYDRWENMGEDVTWETCSLRAWLNNEFINEAFSEEEQKSIMQVELDNSLDPRFYEEFPNRTDTGGNTTEDKIFCLSAEDAVNPSYGFAGTWEESPTRVATYTQLAQSSEKLDGINNFEEDMSSLVSQNWWLRTTGWPVVMGAGDEGMSVMGTGMLEKGGALAPEAIGVRPALHLDISDTSVWSYAGKIGE